MNVKFTCVLGVVCLALLGCGSSGSGSGAASPTPIPQPTPSPNPTPAPPPAPIPNIGTASSVTADALINLATGQTTVTNNSNVRNTLNYDFIEENGVIVAINVTGANGSFSVDARNGDLVVDSTDSLIFVSQSVDTTGAFLKDFDHLSFGFWEVTTGSNSVSEARDLGVAVLGNPTPNGNIPPGGSATVTYAGASVGFAEQLDGLLYDTVSSVTAVTDFSNITFNSFNSRKRGQTPGAGFVAAPELDYTGTAVGNPVGFYILVQGVNAPSLSGLVDAVYYGPAAEEVGGTFSLSLGGTNDFVYIGAFGAARQ